MTLTDKTLQILEQMYPNGIHPKHLLAAAQQAEHLEACFKVDAPWVDVPAETKTVAPTVRELVSVKEAAKVLGVTTQSVYAAINAKYLVPVSTAGRRTLLDKADVLKYGVGR